MGLSAEANRRLTLLPMCPDCRVRMEPQDYENANAHAVNCAQFQRAKQEKHFMTTGDKLDKVFASVETQDWLVRSLAEKLRKAKPEKRAELVSQLTNVLREWA